MIRPAAAAEHYALADGVLALAGGFAFLERSRTLLCADAHFGYEDVVGAALPLWSTTETAAAIAVAAARVAAREIVFLGDVIHAATMSAGAGDRVRAALAMLGEIAPLTLIAGNHEGRSGGRDVLGPTVVSCERDGWLLLHGDKPPRLGGRSIVGHVHPSLHLDGRASAPVFLAARDLVVVPALTPYSDGLHVLSQACATAIAAYGVRRADVQVVAVTAERVYPLGSLDALESALQRPNSVGRQTARRRLVCDGDGGG